MSSLTSTTMRSPGPTGSQTAAVFAESMAIAICTGKVDALSLDSAGARLFEANGGFARRPQDSPAA
jgi:hypothetical protein